MQPDRTNYEIWLIDYLDGTLDEDRVKQLISFLDENPDIREEFEELAHYNIKPGDKSFTYKNLLKKSSSDLSKSQFELLCVAASENDLSEQQREDIQMIIAENQEKRKTFDLINRLKLVAPAVKYNNKSLLRKLTPVQKIVRLSVIGLSAAAGIAVLISIFNISDDNNYKFNPLISTNLSGDSIKVKVRNNTEVANINTAENKDIRRPDRLNVFSTPKKTGTAEMIVSPVISFASDSSAGPLEIERIKVSKIDYKQDVELLEKEFTGTLIAMKTDETSSSGMQEKPGFNEFLAKVFRNKIMKSKTSETGSIKAYEIADAGINGLNKLLGWQMSLLKTRDDKGDLKSLYFSSKILKFNAPVKKVQFEP
jgi:hypothetical protein